MTVDNGTLYMFFAGKTTVDNWPVSGRFDFVLDTGLPGMNPLTGPAISRGNYSNFANTNGGDMAWAGFQRWFQCPRVLHIRPGE